MIATAKGQLAHHFWGTYSASIALAFDSAGEAEAANAVLGSAWKRGPHAVSLIAHVDKAGLDAIKERFAGAGFYLTVPPCGWRHCKGRCRQAPIDSLAHSVDYGPEFALTVYCEDPRQLALAI